ncbi:MAG: nicotinate-nucleotide adenylyltransferase [Nitrospinae bacterium]|jgi:nicotinate-nucleotide adenylyltransferase|nr:nicotinate-nucleotide adenylyltransferase [Nitrospinota bacterium]MDA1109915.1 nicotinate-nucleotide adenylyltransferase [Nitrospinota bacterium]
MGKENRKRVGILGGSFDPVHNGHIGLATQVRERFHLDHILFVPAYISPHKQDRQPASSSHRLAMLRLATASQPFFLISEMELIRKEISFTIDTLTVLLNEQPETDFYLIMGMDAFEGIGTWKTVHKLFESCHIIIASRPGYTMKGIEKTLKSIFHDSSIPFLPATKDPGLLTFCHREKQTTLKFFDLPPLNVSSSQIRERIATHQEVKNMLPPEVENYIMQNQLYRAKSHL